MVEMQDNLTYPSSQKARANTEVAVPNEQVLEILRGLFHLHGECARSLDPWCVTSPDCSYDGQYAEYGEWLIKALRDSQDSESNSEITLPETKYEKIMRAYQIAVEFTEFCREINID